MRPSPLAPRPSLMSSTLSTPFQPAVTTESLPRDLRGGAHVDLVKPGTVTFVLRAPYKPYVSLVGEFNGWNTRAHVMHTDGSGTWWITIPHPGQTLYGYYVLVDEFTHEWVGDPYAVQVDWTRETPWGVLPSRRPSFRWTDQKWRTPPLREMVIYEVCVRDAAGAWEGNRAVYGTIRRLTERIPYLVRTGVNAIELMPIQSFPGESSWGYNPVFYHAIADSYGKPDEFKAFVDRCHANGIAVILDVAFNHAWGDHPYYRIYPPMYGEHGERWTDWNPFFHHTPSSINMWGGVDWDHFEPDATRYFQDVVRFWLEEYHVDGFRFDWVGGVDYDHRDPMRPGFNPFHGISAVCWAAKQAKPECVLIGEYWTLHGTHPEKNAVKLVQETAMDAVWNGTFHHTMEEVLSQRWQWERKDIHRAIGGFRDLGYSLATQVVNYTCSHDEVRPEHEIKFYAAKHIKRPPGMSLQAVALAKARLGLVALFAAPGVPMIYAGQEYGEDSPRTIDFVPLQWHKLSRDEHTAHYALTQRLIRARRMHPALRSDWIDFLPDDFARDKYVRFHRWDGAGDHAVVALNFDWIPAAVELSFPWDGRWRDVVSNRVRTVKGGRLRMTLGPSASVLFLPEKTRK